MGNVEKKKKAKMTKFKQSTTKQRPIGYIACEENNTEQQQQRRRQQQQWNKQKRTAVATELKL